MNPASPIYSLRRILGVLLVLAIAFPTPAFALRPTARAQAGTQELTEVLVPQTAGLEEATHPEPQVAEADSTLRHVLVVIGAGPSGLAAALKAANEGYWVLILDQTYGYTGQAKDSIFLDKLRMKIRYLFDRALGRTGEKRDTLRLALEHPNIIFIGGVRVGEKGSVTPQLLREQKLTPFLGAAGAEIPKIRGVKGLDLDLVHVLGAQPFVFRYNSRPGYADVDPLEGPETSVVGIGNVALDILSFLLNRADYEAVRLFVRSLTVREYRAMLEALGLRSVDFETGLLDNTQLLLQNLRRDRPGIGRSVQVDDLEKALESAAFETPELKERLKDRLTTLQTAESVNRLRTTLCTVYVRRDPTRKTFTPPELVHMIGKHIDTADLKEEFSRVQESMGWTDDERDIALEQFLFEHPDARDKRERAGTPYKRMTPEAFQKKLGVFGSKISTGGGRVVFRFLHEPTEVLGQKNEPLEAVVFQQKIRDAETGKLVPAGDPVTIPMKQIVFATSNQRDRGVLGETPVAAKEQEADEVLTADHFRTQVEDFFAAGWFRREQGEGVVGEAIKDGEAAVELAVKPYSNSHSDQKMTRAEFQAQVDQLQERLRNAGVRTIDKADVVRIQRLTIEYGIYPDNNQALLALLDLDAGRAVIWREPIVPDTVPAPGRVFIQSPLLIPEIAQQMRDRGVEFVSLAADSQTALDQLDTQAHPGDLILIAPETLSDPEVRGQWEEFFRTGQLRGRALGQETLASFSTTEQWAALIASVQQVPGIARITRAEITDGGRTLELYL